MAHKLSEPILSASFPEHSHPFLAPQLISESEVHSYIQPDELDAALAHGWRTHGSTFFRYNLWNYGSHYHWIMPLRLCVAAHEPGKSQLRILRRNHDLTLRWRVPTVDSEHKALFELHTARFQDNAPVSLHDYLTPDPGESPCVCRELEVRHQGRLIASSYVHIGLHSMSSVYAMFDPVQSQRSLGIFTMLMEIDRAEHDNLRWWYPGYTTLHHSIYDYKKNFHGLQYYDWCGAWHPFPKGGFTALLSPTSSP